MTVRIDAQKYTISYIQIFFFVYLLFNLAFVSFVCVINLQFHLLYDVQLTTTKT